jgi:integrase
LFFLFSREKFYSTEYVFCNDEGERLTANTISRRLSTVCNRLGLKVRSPHKVRKTVGTILFDATVDNRLILNQMGWSSEAVGETHYHRDRKSNDQKIGILSSIPEFQLNTLQKYQY